MKKLTFLRGVVLPSGVEGESSIEELSHDSPVERHVENGTNNRDIGGLPFSYPGPMNKKHCLKYV